MVISFTIAKKGKRYRPQPRSVEEVDANVQDQDVHSDGAPLTQNQNQSQSQSQNEDQDQNQGNPTMHTSPAMAKSFDLFKSTLEQLEALGPSFSLNLFEDGFTIGDTNEIFHDVPKNIIPYNCIQADSILTNVECGRIPTGVLQDKSLKYVNGTILCEVRDYRVFIEFPIIVATIPLKMGLDNIIEDMSSMPQEFSYGDMLTFQSTVLRYLYPHLNLDPTPKPDFRIDETIPVIDLGVEERRKRRRADVSSHVDSLLDRFLNIDALTRRHVIGERKPVECPNLTNSGYTTTLISTRLNEVERNNNSEASSSFWKD